MAAIFLRDIFWFWLPETAASATGYGCTGCRYGRDGTCHKDEDFVFRLLVNAVDVYGINDLCGEMILFHDPAHPAGGRGASVYVPDGHPRGFDLCEGCGSIGNGRDVSAGGGDRAGKGFDSGGRGWNIESTGGCCHPLHFHTLL